VPATEKQAPRCKLSDDTIRGFTENLESGCPVGKWAPLDSPASSKRVLSKRVWMTSGSSKSVGLVIGTYGAVPYIHLQLESLRRFHPGTPCLVVDDFSPQREQLAGLCREYGAEFCTNSKRLGHVAGDMNAFCKGHAWANERKLEYLVKFSRRWIPVVPWIDEFVRVARATGAPTLNNRCEFHGFGFRSECVGMHVPTWRKANALAPIQENIRRAQQILPSGVTADQQHVFLVEGIVHEAAHQASKRGGEIWKKFIAERPPRRGCEHYAEWPLMGHSRRHPQPGVLWHEWARPEGYHSQLKAWGIHYPLPTMFDSAGNIQGSPRTKRLLDADLYRSVFEPLVGRRITYVPLPGNWGDRLIDIGAHELFAHFQVEVVNLDRLYSQDHGMSGILPQTEHPRRSGIVLTANVRGFNPNVSDIDCIVVAGGGSMGTFYKNSAAIRAHLLTLGKPVVVLPSTFTDVDPCIAEFEAVYAREWGSLSYHSKAIVAPDLALAVTPLESRPATKERGLFLRRDSEALFKDLRCDADPHACGSLNEYLAMAERHESIVTDCLHFAIAGLYFRREVTLLPGSIHKNRSMWEAWLHGLGVDWKDSP
jgi:hypothetical protein